MYALGRTGARRSINIWPGFVDGLATLLLVVMFVLMVFMVAQFYLSTALSGRDEALQRLNREIDELAELLALERAANADLRINVAQLSSELQSSIAERETLSSQLSALMDERDSIQIQLEAAANAQESLTAQLAALIEEREALERVLAEAEVAAAKNREELEAAYSTIEADKEKIEAQLSELAILKSLEEEMTEKLAGMEAALEDQEESAEFLAARVAELEAALAEREEAATSAQEESREQSALLTALRMRLTDSEKEAENQLQLTKAAQARINLLNRQIAALRQQLSRLAVTLEAIEAQNAEKDVQIADLGRRLNVALATKVQELARYRSEFFGRLREVLGAREDIRVVGDRFVFQSELLFGTGSAQLGPEGREQIARLADTLKQLSAQIPPDLDWILRVDGHTDKRPIYTAAYPSNWELSTARALSVVNFLVEQGIPPSRLGATGFGEHHPLDPGEDEEAYRRNRRIELKFTQK